MFCYLIMKYKINFIFGFDWTLFQFQKIIVYNNKGSIINLLSYLSIVKLK